MRFLDTTTCQFVDADPAKVEYAILSHTWDNVNGEQDLQALKKIQERYSAENTIFGSTSARLLRIARRDDISPIWKDSDLSPKVRDACAVARKYGFRLIWIDSCCIDKTSSSELSEAINSMYAWYAGAQVCYAYLVDVTAHDDHRAVSSQFRKSVWFTRGWTLQELIAPYELIILSADWKVVGSKRDLVDVIEEITGVSAYALLHEEPLDKFSVAQRLSWASYRQTTRVEDRAYSLLGIFKINIPTLYGEGERAFRRLQEAIMERIPDQTLFAWGSICDFPDIEALLDPNQPSPGLSFECFETIPVTSILAPSPIDFASAGSLTAVPHDEVYNRLGIPNHSPPEYTPTPHGIRTQLPVIRLDRYLAPSTVTAYRSEYSLSEWYLVILSCQESSPIRHLGSLLGSICYIPVSGSGLNRLYCGMIRRSRGTRDAAESEPRRSSSANLFPLSSATLERCRAEAELKGVYIVHANPAALDWTLQAAVTVNQSSSLSRSLRKTIHFSLTRKSLQLLHSNGYVVELRDALHGDDPATIVKLSGEGHTITAEYRYTQNKEGFLIRRTITTEKQVGGRAGVRVGHVHSGPRASSKSDHDSSSSFLAYNSPPTKALLPEEVVITTSDGISRTMALRLNFERWSSFTLEVYISAPREASIYERLTKMLNDAAQKHSTVESTVGMFGIPVSGPFIRRRENDKTVLRMFGDMRDLMAVFIQLRDINKDKRAEEGSTGTISERMQPIVGRTAEDIKRCANFCDTYAKQRIVSKIMHSSSWRRELNECIQRLTDRRHEFELALSLYIDHAVSTANHKPSIIKEETDPILPSSSPASDHTGGPNAPGVHTTERKARFGGRVMVTFRKRHKWLWKDVKAAVRENMEDFKADSVIQQREREEGLRRTMYREGDRIIDAVTRISEPYDEILDPDIHQIWKNMCWGASVNLKDQHFILTLRDHFCEKLKQIKPVQNNVAFSMPTANRLSGQDEWTLEYLDVTRVQPIIEAFDDKALGFIKVAEVNTFTTTRPENWSLPHWIAYWAVGHQMSMSNYAGKIDILLANMSALKTHVLPANRNAMEQYLCTVWAVVTMLTASLCRVAVDKQLLHRFEEYTQAEEKRLLENLKTAQYNIDTRDTLDLICGPGRIEKHVLRLLYLLLKHHFEIMRLARTRCLPANDLCGSMHTIMCVFAAINDRHSALADLFKQQKLDPAQQFNIFAFEMFKHWNDEKNISAIKHKEAIFPEVAVDSGTEAQNIDPANIIDNLLQPTEEFFYAHQDASCHVCGAWTTRDSRIVCLSCGSKTTVDLCGRNECLTSEMRLDVRGNLVSFHLPSHEILKLPTAIHPYREYRLVYHTAPKALARVHQLFAGSVSTDAQREGGTGTANRPSTCVKCGERTSPPCWYCIECEEDVFVCILCDAQRGGTTRRNLGHNSIHALVRCESTFHNHDNAETKLVA